MTTKINHLLEAYPQLITQNENCVLATIIETFGSSYQKAGARLLITHAGELIGLLGGGCFERDLVEQARAVFDTGLAKTVFYDMRSAEDVVWGLGLGCNGAVRVLLQLLSAQDGFSPLNSLIEAANADVSGVLVTVVESIHPDFPAGASCFLSESSSIPVAFRDFAEQTRKQQKPRLESQTIGNYPLSVFYDFLPPLSHLLVLGAGADAIPLVNCAKSLGWRVTIADHRPAHIKKERFPAADCLLYAIPEELSEHLNLNQFNALVLMTHNFEYDARYLKAIVNADIAFIGLLGPAPRKQGLLQSLGDDAERIRERVFGPVGLNIGAKTPEEIALSIMAGIYAELNQRSGQPLDQQVHECR
jgi:xanthine/CO dehydrogenase XdhC/CoxF family maturation factor